jgi:microcystin-dependent protein
MKRFDVDSGRPEDNHPGGTRELGQRPGPNNYRGDYLMKEKIGRLSTRSNQHEAARTETGDVHMRSGNTRLAETLVLLLFGGFGLAQPAMAGPEEYLGEIMYVGFNFCPRGTAEASGQLLPIAQNTALFALLGTIYGGDGQTTFALPDLRGRVPVHAGQAPGLSNVDQGEMGGAESRTLTFAQMPSHAHTATTTVADIAVTSVLRGSDTNGNSKSPGGNALAITKQPSYASASPATDMAAGSVQSTVTGGSATTTVDATNSGSSPVGVRDPFLGLRACIALQGIFPSRD